jgi:hypothetical protein
MNLGLFMTLILLMKVSMPWFEYDLGPAVLARINRSRANRGGRAWQDNGRTGAVSLGERLLNKTLPRSAGLFAGGYLCLSGEWNARHQKC